MAGCFCPSMSLRDELKKITPELRVEGIEVGVPPETALVTLTRTVMEKLQHPELKMMNQPSRS